jgi:RNA polymerase sigma-70 factor (ECF subfamily)
VSALRSVPRVTAATEEAVTTARGLYERHGQRVLTFCMSRLRNLQEAQDATQTTFLYVLRALDRGQRPRSEVAWLLAIANNVCRSTQRTLYRRNSRTTYAEIDELEAAAEAIGAEHEDLIWLRGALERLPENQRKAILLREWQGLSYADMAAELGLTVPAVEALLFRARRTLAADRTGAGRLRAAFDGASLVLGIRSLRHGVAAKAAAVGAGVTLAATPFVVAGVAARRVSPVQHVAAVRAASAGHSQARSHRSSSTSPRKAVATRKPAGPGSTTGADTTPSVTPPQQQPPPPPASEPPAGVQLPPVPPLPPLPPLPPAVTDVLAQVPALPPVVQATAAGLP